MIQYFPIRHLFLSLMQKKEDQKASASRLTHIIAFLSIFLVYLSCHIKHYN